MVQTLPLIRISQFLYASITLHESDDVRNTVGFHFEPTVNGGRWVVDYYSAIMRFKFNHIGGTNSKDAVNFRFFNDIYRLCGRESDARLHKLQSSSAKARD